MTQFFIHQLRAISTACPPSTLPVVLATPRSTPAHCDECGSQIEVSFAGRLTHKVCAAAVWHSRLGWRHEHSVHPSKSAPAERMSVGNIEVALNLAVLLLCLALACSASSLLWSGR